MNFDAKLTFPMSIDASPLFRVLDQAAARWKRQLDRRIVMEDIFKPRERIDYAPRGENSHKAKTGAHINIKA